MKVALVPWLRYGLPVTFSGGAPGSSHHDNGSVGISTRDKITGGAWTILPSGQTEPSDGGERLPAEKTDLDSNRMTGRQSGGKLPPASR